MGVLMVRDVDDKLRQRFKAACALDGRTMRGAIVAFMGSTADSRDILQARMLQGTGREGGARKRRKQ